MKNDRLTVAEFAQAVGRSEKTIYKQLNTRLLPFLIEENGRKWLKKEALALYNTPDDSTDTSPEILKIVQKTLNNLELQLANKDAQIDHLYEVINRSQSSEGETRQLLLLEKKQNLQLSGKIESSNSGEESREIQLLKEQLEEEKANAAALKNELEELRQDQRLNIPVDIHGRPIFEKSAVVQYLIKNAKKEAENAFSETMKRQIKDIIETIQEGRVYLKDEEVIHMFFMPMPTVILDEPTCIDDLVNLQDTAFKAGYNQGWNEAKPPWKKAK